jgi:hypothetical protein
VNSRFEVGCAASGPDLKDLEHRQLELHGESEPTDIRLLRVSANERMATDGKG